MSRAKIQAIVRFLGSPETAELPTGFSGGNDFEWQRVLEWLDSSGLALYFLHELQRHKLTNSIPDDLLVSLETRQRNNSARTLRMRSTFEVLNRRFEEAGVRYAILKGFSLVPEYCPDPSVRAQSDLDYLIAPDSLSRADQILTEQGYLLKSKTGCESAYWIPCAEPHNSSVQYDPNTAYMVELHTALWDHGLNDVPMATRVVDFGKLQRRSFAENQFYTLPDNEIFVGQILHCFRHFMQGLVRPSWLFEINYFLKHNANCIRVCDIVELTDAAPCLAEIVGIMLAVIEKTYESKQPAAQYWITRLDAVTKGWLERYGRDVAYERTGISRNVFLPKAKLLLFLQAEFPIYSHRRRQLWWESLVPVGAGFRFWRRRKSLKRAASRPNQSKKKWVVSRIWYHAGSNLRLVAELPRWRRIKRSLSRQVDPAPISTVRSPGSHGRLLT